MVAAILFISFAVLLLMGAPIAVCLGTSSVVAMIAQGSGRPLDTVMSSLPMIVSASTSKFVLLAIPFFILAGNIMEKAGISEKLIKLAEACVGHIRGGLAIVCVIVACFFAAISGSGPATVAALGVIIVPAMIKSGYKPAFSAALMAAAGAIGVIIPPSITFVVYGSIADTSIGDLFIAGLVPGLLMGFALMVVALLVGRKSDLKTLPKASRKERWLAFKDAFWGLMMPVIILGGIYGGIFTPTEAAAVSVIYSLIIGLFVHKELNFKQMLDVTKRSCETTATILVVIGCATGFSKVLTLGRIPTTVATLLTTMTDSKVLILLLINLLLLLVGCFMETVCAIMILAPILFPVVTALGVDPIHFGIIMVTNLAIGFITPPLGVNLFVASRVGETTLDVVIRGIVPFLVLMIATLMLITYVPAISMFLPNLLG